MLVLSLSVISLSVLLVFSWKLRSVLWSLPHLLYLPRQMPALSLPLLMPRPRLFLRDPSSPQSSPSKLPRADGSLCTMLANTHSSETTCSPVTITVTVTTAFSADAVYDSALVSSTSAVDAISAQAATEALTSLTMDFVTTVTTTSTSTRVITVTNYTATTYVTVTSGTISVTANGTPVPILSLPLLSPIHILTLHQQFRSMRPPPASSLPLPIPLAPSALTLPTMAPAAPQPRPQATSAQPSAMALSRTASLPLQRLLRPTRFPHPTASSQPRTAARVLLVPTLLVRLSSKSRLVIALSCLLLSLS